jgi:alkylhydroperoxidase/carboxymuconolactone decarboxylase family protein YurZ
MQRRTLAALIPGAALTAAGVAFAKENDMTNIDLSVTDPDLIAIRERFLKKDVPSHTSALTERERFLVQATTLTTLSEPLSLKRVVKEALAAGVKPLEIREAVYQPFAYIGKGRNGRPRHERSLPGSRREASARIGRDRNRRRPL